MHDAIGWGMPFDEYQGMFDLLFDTKTRYLEYACGPNEANARLHQQGGQMVSCDSLFSQSQAILNDIITQAFNASPDLLHTREDSIATFLADYPTGQHEKRYLPLIESDRPNRLPFEHFSFDVALSAFYLFNDTAKQTPDFMIQVIRELARVAKDVRVFPLSNHEGEPSAQLGHVLLGLQQEGFGVEIRQVKTTPYASSKAMLRVWAQQCHLT